MRPPLIEALEQRALLTGAAYEDRGWVSVLVDNTLSSGLTARLQQFKRDLIGDGWTVSLRVDAPRMDDENYVYRNTAPGGPVPVTNSNFPLKEQYKSELQIVKDMIAADATAAIAAGSELKQVILIGHVTVPYSGLTKYDGHDNRAFPTDLYYADLDATPQTWGDYYYNSSNGGDSAHELTTNQPGDSRFDADKVPGNAQVVTVTGSSGTFTLTFNNSTTNPPIQIGASAADVRNALNALPSIQLGQGFVTVIESPSGVYTVNFLGLNFAGTNQPQMTAAATGDVNVSIQTLSNGGTEVAIGRIDMANLDAAFPTSETPLEFEAKLINRYLQRNHEWRIGARAASPLALLDPISPQGGFVDLDLQSIVGSGNVVRDLTWPQAFGQTDPPRYLFASAQFQGNADVIWHTQIPPTIYYPEFTSYDFDPAPVHAIFATVYASYMGDWNARSLRSTDASRTFTDQAGNGPLWPYDPNHPVRANLIRSILGSDGDALVATLYNGVGAPKGWFTGSARLGLGYSAGEAFHYGLHHLSHGDIHEQLIGDPTIRMHVVKPPTNVRAQTLLNTLGVITGRRITWDAPDETGLLGYRLYRTSSVDGPFTPIHTGLWSSPLTFDDPYTGASPAYYMVRAVKSQAVPNSTETYQNASQGAVVRTTAAQPNPQPFFFATTHEITVQFDRNVQSVLSAGDLLLENLTTQEQVAVSNINLSYNTATNTATFTFQNIPGSVGPNGSILVDGNYRATIAASDVVLNGEDMTQDAVLDFFVLAGDANRDRTVNLNDFNIVAQNFGQSPRDFTQGDFNYDTQVNLSDFNIMTANFGTVLAAPPSGPDVITVSVLSPNQVEASWFDDVQGETGWRVQWSADGVTFNPNDYVNIVGDLPNGQVRSATVGPFPDGRRLWFRMRAYSDPIMNPNGPETSYTPKRSGTMLLPAPSDLQLTPVAGRIDLSWNISTTQATRVYIQRSTNGFEWDTIHDQDPTILTYSDTTVQSGTRYYYRVYLHNDDIDSAPSFVEQIVA